MRPHQEELFPLPVGFHPAPQRKEPLLWVREMRIYRVFSPNPAHLLRRIALRRGLNILWAKPRERSPSAQQRAPGVSGHATGKTSFCRFLRYLLGESTFGNDEQRARLREAFPDGYVVGEVHLDGTPWLVCRPFRVGGPPHVAFRGRKIETVFADSDEGRTTFDEFRQELTRVLAEPLPVATFATAPLPIEWPHLLQWLARDQECRFAGLAELRHASSDSHSPTMVAEDTHFLFRAALGLIDPAEQVELETNKLLLKRKQEAEHDAPLLQFRGGSACQRLRDQLGDFRTDLDGAEFLQAVAREWAERATASEKALRGMAEPAELQQAREKVLDARDLCRRAEGRQEECRARLGLIEEQIRQLRGDISPGQFATWMNANVHSDRDCGRTLAEAIQWGCPLAVGRQLPPVENKPAAVSTPASLEEWETQKAREAIRLTQAGVELERCQQLASDAAADLQRETGAYDQTRAELARERAAAEAIAREAQRAGNDKAEADRLEGSIKDLEQNIRRSQERQAAIREQRSAALSEFAQTFARVTRTIFDEEVEGSIQFSGRKVRPTLVYDIDLTSAALETLKIICFDLAALISGVEGRGNHPGFLIHDGPREADMDAELYQQIFVLARKLEGSFKEGAIGFQYIVTTTEPPPAELQMAPWLLDPVLDATSPQGKLLTENF